MRGLCLLVGIGLLSGGGSLVLADSAPGRGRADSGPAEFFERRVRPLLVDSCLRCHGPKKQSSGLRIDSREALLEGGENGPAIVPGEPEKSLLVQVVRHAHEDIRMPPKRKLPAPEIAALADWVQQGAPWPQGIVLSPAERDHAAESHWAFQPLREVAPPAVQDRSWVATPYDAFILARLEREGMSPAARADRRTLIRRATFDLTGLPPTAEEIDAFEADTSPDAFAKVVDRLLASPRYGERWGRHWLDVARYADTKGYVFTEERRYPYAYTYRDYVIRAFNDDLPYDRFLVEQLAADQLPPGGGGDNRNLAALGFLTVGRRFLNNQQDIIDDRIDVVSRGLMGLTVACARCHDHKFDPVPTDDYYSLYGVFASSLEPAELPLLPRSTATAETLDFERQVKDRQAKLDEFLASKRAEIQADLRQRVDAYWLASFDLGFDPRHAKLDDRARADKLAPGRLRWAMAAWKTYLGARQRVDDPAFGPWHALAAIPAAEFAAQAPAVLRRLADEAGVSPLFTESLGRRLAGDPPADLAGQLQWSARVLASVERRSRPAVAIPAGRRLVVERLAAGPLRTLRDVAVRYAEILAEAAGANDRSRTPASPAGDADRIAIRRIVHADDGPTGVPADSLARVVDRAERNRIRQLTNNVAALAASHPGAPPRAMVLNDAAQPTDPRVFIRGNPGRPGKSVPRQFLKVLAGPERTPFRKGSGRLEMARAIADPRNPLTARVLVNRVWMFHFGTGLVSTPSDFGLRSDPPSHPELLDLLALEFVRGGWSIKSLHRRIMLSSVYQQGSGNNPAYHSKDPGNRLLWRYPRTRLDFESMRDALLAVSGQLDLTMGGRSVPIAGSPSAPRRTVYGFIDRQNLDGDYRTFDFPSPDATSPRRHVTTVPQQALFLMNSPFVIDTARHLARSLDDSSGPEARVRALYRRILGRSPEPHEVALGVRFTDGQARTDRGVPQRVWQQGSGSYTESSRRVEDFTALGTWTGSVWQAGPKRPDPGLGYLHLTATGGHVGPDVRHAAIRRWTAPRDALVAITGTLGHAGSKGDGVRGRIVASRGGELGQWIAHGAKVPTTVDRYEVKTGETIDFVVDGRSEPSFDSFTWSPVLRELGPDASAWNAETGFAGPPPPVLSPWEQYVQVLLLTNEFAFVD